MQLIKATGTGYFPRFHPVCASLAPLCSIAGFTPQGCAGFPPAAPEPLSPPAPYRLPPTPALYNGTKAATLLPHRSFFYNLSIL